MQAGGGEQKLPFQVIAKKYAVQQLKVAPGQVNLSPENEARVAGETEKVKAALNSFTPAAPPTLRLVAARAGPALQLLRLAPHVQRRIA